MLILERGDWLPRRSRTGTPRRSSSRTDTSPKDTWYDKDGKAFQPQVHYNVGGATKFYGAALYRFGSRTSGNCKHHGGISPAWPVGYDVFEPYYTQAEELYQVHGIRGEDPAEPPASAPYPFPRSPTSPGSRSCSTAWPQVGPAPLPLPNGIMLDEANPAFSPCIRCATCDGFPCLVHAKSDADVIAVRPALVHDNVTLLRNAQVTRSRPTRPAAP